MSRLPLILALQLLVVSPAAATHFWISPYNDALGSTPPSTAGTVPTIPSFVTQNTGSVYIWAKPDSTKTLQNWSLRLESKNLGTVIKFTNTHVYNPFLTGPDPNDRRWEYVVEPTTNAAISGQFMGFTLTNNDFTGKGIGPGTAMNDSYYFGPLDGSGSWLLAKVDYTAQNVVGSTDLYLQIGRLGLNNVGASVGATTVVFGHTGEAPISPNPASTQRLKSFGSADAKVQVHATPDADFNNDGIVSGTDFLIWQRFAGTTSGMNSKGNATYLAGDVNIDNVDLAAWEFQYGTTIPIGGSLQVVPEPTTLGLLGTAFLLMLARPVRRGDA